MAEEDKEQDAPVVEKQTDERVDIEEQAREFGWLPEAEWKGKKEYWKPADVFIAQRPKYYIPELEKKIGKLESANAKLKSDFTDFTERMSRANAKALKSKMDSLEREYDAKILKATELGDTEAAKKAMADKRTDMKALTEQAEETVVDEQADKKGADTPAQRKQLEAWLEDNEWYASNKPLARRFDYFYAVVEEEMPAASLKERMAEARERLIEAEPEKFGKKNARSRVEGGARNGGGSGSGEKGWQDLPAEVKKVAEKMISEKLFKDHADYAREYWAEEQAA